MAAQAGKAQGTRDVLMNVAAIAVFVALVAVGLAYGIDALDRNAEKAAARTQPALVSVNVSGVALQIPENWLRFGSAPDDTFSDRLDLAIPLDLGGSEPQPVTMTLVPKARARASSALLDSVYLQFFSPEEKKGVSGLIGKPLKPESGYMGETVWYDALSPNPFVAKCQAPLPGSNTSRCIRTVFFDNVAGVYAFDEPVLERWRDFDRLAEAVLAGIGVKRTK